MMTESYSTIKLSFSFSGDSSSKRSNDAHNSPKLQTKTLLIMHKTTATELKELVYALFSTCDGESIVGFTDIHEDGCIYPLSALVSNIQAFHQKSLEIVIYNPSLLQREGSSTIQHARDVTKEPDIDSSSPSNTSRGNGKISDRSSP